MHRALTNFKHRNIFISYDEDSRIVGKIVSLFMLLEI